MVKQAIDTKFMKLMSESRVGIVRVLDLCAGNASWGIIAKQELEALGFKVHLIAVEIDPTILPTPEVDAWVTDDFRNVLDLGQFDFIFSNPPFSLVYEITAWAKKHLTDWGIFTLLIGSNFMFAQTELNKHLVGIRPLFEIKWTRRPSFIQVFSAKAYGQEVRKTNAKDYCGYYFGGQELWKWLDKRDSTVAYLNLPDDTQPWLTFDSYWAYEDDPLQSVIEERAVTVQQALIREAAELAKSHSDLKFDYDFALIAANFYGWDFYNGSTLERLAMLDTLVDMGVTEENWQKYLQYACPLCGSSILFASDVVRCIECQSCGWTGQSLSEVCK